MIIFKIYTPEKCLKKLNNFKEFFRRCIHDSFQSLQQRKFFKQAEKLQRIFFEGVFMIIFHNIHPEKYSKQANNFKEFFLKVNS